LEPLLLYVIAGQTATKKQTLEQIAPYLEKFSVCIHVSHKDNVPHLFLFIPLLLLELYVIRVCGETSFPISFEANSSNSGSSTSLLLGLLDRLQKPTKQRVGNANEEPECQRNTSEIFQEGQRKRSEGRKMLGKIKRRGERSKREEGLNCTFYDSVSGCKALNTNFPKMGRPKRSADAMMKKTILTTSCAV
jgi:hypothetical protein